MSLQPGSGKTEQLLGSYPADLVGVAVFGNGGFKTVLTNPFPDLEPYTESLELARFVLLDEVPANAETWFLARVFELAAAQGVAGVVSFSDPIKRTTSDGRVVMPGHIGLIYQASNATYTGKATPRTIWQLPDGTIFNEQKLGKIRQQKQGHQYAEEELCSWGARPRRPRQDPKAWLQQARTQIGARTERHPGNHRYLFTLAQPGLDKRQRAAARADNWGVAQGYSPLPYPKATQRWQAGQHSWRPTSEGGFNSRHFEVAPLDIAASEAFVMTHHYSGSCPSNLQRYGLFLKETHS